MYILVQTELRYGVDHKKMVPLKYAFVNSLIENLGITSSKLSRVYSSNSLLESHQSVHPGLESFWQLHYGEERLLMMVLIE